MPLLLRETLRLLRPGGWALHSIDTQDHLSHYDETVSKKLYLTFSERTWANFFENKVQYINRLQREWMALFKEAGFELVEENSWHVDISRLNECGVLRALFRKPV